ncbi:hypothetical protein JCM8115_000012 [Rhodotorula mucilaginosa]
MPKEDTDPAAEPFLAGTDQRDLLSDEPDYIRLRSLEHAEERYRDPEKPRRGALAAARPSRRALVVLALAVVLLSLFPLRHQSLNALLSATSESSARSNVECDPYAKRGVLRIDLDDWSGNRWEPALATDCQPRDYLSQIYRDGRNLSNEPGLDFLRDRVILLFGDSVDRGFLEHFCRIFALGRFEHIGPGHELDPPLPLGREHAPPGYRSDRGDKDWVGNPMGRPSLCYLPSYNTYLLNVFQFGLHPEDETVIHFTHFLPPGGFEDRFDTFVVPILERLAQSRTKARTLAEQEAGSASPPRVLSPLRRPISTAPDLITLAATF